MLFIVYFVVLKKSEIPLLFSRLRTSHITYEIAAYGF